MMGGMRMMPIFFITMALAKLTNAFQKLCETTGMPAGFTLDDSDLFGRSIASLGDLNGDGVPDLAAGAMSDDDGGTDTGAVYVVFMNQDGTGKAIQKLSKLTGMPVGFTLDSSDNFGISVASLGDLDGDGVPDLAVGAYRDDDGGTDTGAVYVVFMNQDGTGKAFQKLSKLTGMPVGFTLDSSDYFGTSVSSLGDLDGDGVPDLAAGAQGDDDGGINTGAVYVVLMNLDGTGKAFQKLSKLTGMPDGFTLGDSDNFGVSVASIGDIDGDGVPDIAVGAHGDDYGGYDTGAVYVVLMNLDGTGKAFQKLSKTTGMPDGFTLDNSDAFGVSVASLGDLDDDGLSDIAVGAHGTDDGGSSTGAVYVVLMNPDGTGKAFQKLSKVTGMPVDFTLDIADYFGMSIASLGDLDGDSMIEIAVGAPYDDDGGSNKGAVYVVQLDLTIVPTLPPTPLPTNSPSFAPTAFCNAGSFANKASGACVLCPVGQFTNTSRAPFPTKCRVCVAGTFAKEQGLEKCDICPQGKLSSPDRSFCADCKAGEYIKDAKECVVCERGRYAPQPQTGACLLCGAGSFTNNATQATTCSPCNAGSFSLGEVADCLRCQPGKYSTSGSEACKECIPGYFSSAAASEVCSPCASGKVAPHAGSTACVLCPRGTNQLASGQVNCTACVLGSFSDLEGSASCSDCPGNTFSTAMATGCTLCLKYFFYTLEGECVECPAGAVCSQDGRATQELLTLEPGFWRIAPKAAEVYRCELHKACKGGRLVSDGRRLGFNDGANSADWSDGYCNEGYTGPLCSSCARNDESTYYLGIGAESGVTECLRCGDSLDSKTLLSIVTTPIVLIFLIVLFLVAIFALAGTLSGPSIKPSKRHQLLLDQFAEESDSVTLNNDGSTTFTKLHHHKPETVATLKQQTKKSSTAVANLTEVVSTLTEGQILTKSTTRVERGTFVLSLVRNGMKMQVQVKSIIAFLQISGNIGFNYLITWPANFEQVMSAAEVVNLDLVPALGVNCYTTSFDYVEKMVATTLGPLAVAALLLTAYLFVNCTETSGKDPLSRKARVEGPDEDKMYQLPDELNDVFTEKEMAIFRQVFREFDDDGSGEITFRGVVKVMKETSPNLEDKDIEERAREVIAAANTSGNGGVTFADFIRIMDKARNQRQSSPFSEVADKIEASVTKVAGQTLFYIFLAVTFLALVATSTVLFNYFKCRSFPEAADGEESYMYKDSSVDCNSSRYKVFVWYAIAMILIYPVGIPLLYASLLFSHRKALTNSETMFREASNGYPTTGHLLFLTSAYKPEYFYFEVIECLRRLSLASIIGIVAADSAASPVIGLCVSLAFNYLFTSLEPFNVKNANTFSIVLSNSLTLFFVAALMIKTDSVSDDKADQQTFGRLMIVVLCAGPIVTIYLLIKQTATSVFGALFEKGDKVNDVQKEELKTCASGPMMVIVQLIQRVLTTLGLIKKKENEVRQSDTPGGAVDKEIGLTNLGELPSTEEAVAIVWQRFREHGSNPATLYQALLNTAAAEKEKRCSRDEFVFDEMEFDEALAPLRLKGMTAQIAGVLLLQVTHMTFVEGLKVLNEPNSVPDFFSEGELALLERARSPSCASRSPSIDEEGPSVKLNSPRTSRTTTGILNSKLNMSKEQASNRANSSTMSSTPMDMRNSKSNFTKEQASKRSDGSPMEVRMPPRRSSKKTGASFLMRDATPSRETGLSLSEFKGRNSRWTTDTVDFAEGKEATMSPDSSRMPPAATADQLGIMASVDLEANPQQKHLYPPEQADFRGGVAVGSLSSAAAAAASHAAPANKG